MEIYLGKAIVSLERAYHTFLAHDDHHENNVKLTKVEYLVYSHFMRFGCNIRRFKNQSNIESQSNVDTNVDECHEPCKKAYIWNHLYELLGHKKSIILPKNIDQNRYSAIKDSMSTIISQFRNVNSTAPSASSCNFEPDERMATSTKRKLSNDSDTGAPELKAPKFTHQNRTNDQYLGSGSTNDFMVGSTFQKFKQIFNQIDYIDVRRPDSYANQKPINEHISFDLWTSLDNRQCQVKCPDFRLIVK